jgi:hypothetical protein
MRPDEQKAWREHVQKAQQITETRPAMGYHLPPIYPAIVAVDARLTLLERVAEASVKLAAACDKTFEDIDNVESCKAQEQAYLDWRAALAALDGKEGGA